MKLQIRGCEHFRAGVRSEAAFEGGRPLFEGLRISRRLRLGRPSRRRGPLLRRRKGALKSVRTAIEGEVEALMGAVPADGPAFGAVERGVRRVALEVATRLIRGPAWRGASQSFGEAFAGRAVARAGMHWTVAGANAVIAPPCCKPAAASRTFWERRAAKAA